MHVYVIYLFMKHISVSMCLSIYTYMSVLLNETYINGYKKSHFYPGTLLPTDIN